MDAPGRCVVLHAYEHRVVLEHLAAWLARTPESVPDHTHTFQLVTTSRTLKEWATSTDTQERARWCDSVRALDTLEQQGLCEELVLNTQFHTQAGIALPEALHHWLHRYCRRTHQPIPIAVVDFTRRLGGLWQGYVNTSALMALCGPDRPERKELTHESHLLVELLHFCVAAHTHKLSSKARDAYWGWWRRLTHHGGEEKVPWATPHPLSNTHIWTAVTHHRAHILMLESMQRANTEYREHHYGRGEGVISSSDRELRRWLTRAPDELCAPRRSTHLVTTVSRVRRVPWTQVRDDFSDSFDGDAFDLIQRVCVTPQEWTWCCMPRGTVASWRRTLRPLKLQQHCVVAGGVTKGVYLGFREAGMIPVVQLMVHIQWRDPPAVCWFATVHRVMSEAPPDWAAHLRRFFARWCGLPADTWDRVRKFPDVEPLRLCLPERSLCAVPLEHIPLRLRKGVIQQSARFRSKLSPTRWVQTRTREMPSGEVWKRGLLTVAQTRVLKSEAWAVAEPLCGVPAEDRKEDERARDPEVYRWWGVDHIPLDRDARVLWALERQVRPHVPPPVKSVPRLPMQIHPRHLFPSEVWSLAKELDDSPLCSDWIHEAVRVGLQQPHRVVEVPRVTEIAEDDLFGTDAWHQRGSMFS